MKAKRLLLLIFLLAVARTEGGDQNGKLVRWIDPFIATKGGNGQLYPGATTLFGLVKLSPETAGELLKARDVLSYKYAYEGCLWHWKWNVQFDVQGLVNLRGSREELADDLQYFFHC